MTRLWLIAAREYRVRVGSPPFLIGTAIVLATLVLLPLLPALLGLGESQPRHLAVVDHSGRLLEPLSAALDGHRLPDGQPGWQLTPVSPGAAETWAERVRQGEADGLLVIAGSFPDGVQATLRTARPGVLAGSEEVGGALARLVREALAQQSGLDPDLAARLDQPVDLVTEHLGTGANEPTDFGLRLAVAMLAAMLTYFGVLMTGSMLFQGVLEEKTSRVAEVMAGAARSWELLGGKVVGLGLLGLTQFAAWLLPWSVLLALGYHLARDVAAVATPAFLGWLALFFILGYLVYAAVFTAAGSLISRMEDSGTVLFPVLLPTMLPMVLAGALIDNPGGPLAQALTFIPFTAAPVVVMRLVLAPPPWWHVAAAALIMAAAAAVVTWLAGRIYRAAILSFGARPTLRQVWQYLRG